MLHTIAGTRRAVAACAALILAAAAAGSPAVPAADRPPTGAILAGTIPLGHPPPQQPTEPH
ncbi:hypothetical protein GCM10022251_50010 [Phytohabitans flavus]|uniref:Uncharacterized protein n=1 Tax=Phytohabitans flavus TaxID=1076124 RepID=A0A6F8XSD0_9ACTN|nr:hypothetical protein [Phytohabitans flavus]BCB76733.1 hypothetical protein Pflav_031430 [Phytohabitans flavus]